MKGERRRIWKCLMFAFLLTVLTFVSVGCAADTYTVCPGGGCNYTSIQDAINASQPGDTIIVRDGTYTENVEVNVANLTLRSENGSAFTTVLAAVNTSDVFLVTANSVTITGFTVRNATDLASGIHLYSVHHCTISGNNASGNYHGIYLSSSSNNNMLTSNTANSNNNYGIWLWSSSNNNLTSNTANSNNYSGIYLYASSNNTLTGNNASNNSNRGIHLQYSSNNTLTANTVTSNNNYGIYLYSSSNNNNLTSNTASNNSHGIYLYSSSNNNTLTANTVTSNNNYGIYLYSSSNNNNLTSNTASNNSRGIYLDSSSNNNTLTANTANSNNNYGIYLGESSNNMLTSNTASKNNFGILLWSSSNNNLTSNTANSNNYSGIYLYASSNNNMLTSNTASNNSKFGIWLYGSSNNTLAGNTANSNNNCGIRLEETSNNNHIYNNYFNNTINAYDTGNNIWNITPTPGQNIIGGSWLGGNYWSDYDGNDTNGDGLGDTPYDIPGGTNKDYLPLVVIAAPHIFDTGKGDYPSISGTHNGTITPNQTIFVSKLYTYSCPGTGGHTEYAAFYNAITGEEIENGSWNGYVGDWSNIMFNNSFTLYANETYNYTIRTGSYPQIIHADSKDVTGGRVTCEEFVDINGQRHEGWIPAIRLS
jgi:parallel beta-helix repeat protein